LKTIQDENLPIWLPRLAVHGGPRFLQIADALQAAVADGSLKPGDRLPPQRQLAAQLDVDLTTITRAYDEARRRNLLDGRGARGTYVAVPKVELTSILDLSMNAPPPDGVDFDDMLKQGLSQVLMRADNELLMTYHLGGEVTPTVRLEPNGSNRCLDSWQSQRVIPACVPQRPNSAGTSLRWKRTSTRWCLKLNRLEEGYVSCAAQRPLWVDSGHPICLHQSILRFYSMWRWRL
jgi:hypothetical protein